MARRHEPDHPFVWRTVITSHYANGVPYTTYAGPFKARNHATAAATHEMSYGASSYVLQRSKLVWEDVERKENT